MKRLMVVVLAAVAALLVGPMSMAYAGGMGIGNNVAFQCYVISGADPGGTVDLTDRFGTRTSLKIGGARLYCTDVASAHFNGSRNSSQPAPCDALGNGACDLKCYDVKSNKGSNPQVTLSLSDFFFGHSSGAGADDSTIGVAQFVCVGAEAANP
jgi:hypothetical protein